MARGPAEGQQKLMTASRKLRHPKSRVNEPKETKNVRARTTDDRMEQMVATGHGSVLLRRGDHSKPDPPRPR